MDNVNAESTLSRLPSPETKQPEPGAPSREGPPKGYVECRRKCGRWHSPSVTGANISCNHCEADGDARQLASFEAQDNYGPDWTPPLPAKPACKATEWCGAEVLNDNDPREREWFDHGPVGVPRSKDNKYRFCSDACADKIEATMRKPAPYICTPCLVHGPAMVWRHGTGCANAPVEAKGPVCLFFGKKGSVHGGAVATRHWRNMFGDPCSTSVCELHYLTEIEPPSTGTGTPCRAPAGLRRLAHTAGEPWELGEVG